MKTCYGILPIAVSVLAVLVAPGPPDTMNRGPTRAARERMSALQKMLSSHPSLQDGLVPFNQDGEVLLNVTVKVSQIYGLDEVTETVDSFVIIYVAWEDQDIVWNPSNYSNISEVQIPKDRLWSPKLNVVNGGNLDSFLVQASDVVHLVADGRAYYMVPKFLKSNCPLNLYLYPLDTQDCYISIIPAKYVTPGLRIVHGAVQDLKIAPSVKGEWIVSDKSVMMGDLSGFSLMDVRLTLNRRKLFYVVFILVPQFVTSFLIIFVFWIPPGFGERISYLVSIFLANTVVLDVIGANMPRSMDKMPGFLQFILVAIAENVLALVCTMFVLRKYGDESSEGRSLEADVATPEENDSAKSFVTHVTTKGALKSSESNSLRYFKKGQVCHPARVRSEDWKLDRLCRPVVGESTKLRLWKMFPWKIREIRARTWDKIFFFSFLFVFIVLTLALYAELP
ncbi:hypothetical protein BsWGS_03297 [Bradybaena similaris]